MFANLNEDFRFVRFRVVPSLRASGHFERIDRLLDNFGQLKTGLRIMKSFAFVSLLTCLSGLLPAAESKDEPTHSFRLVRVVHDKATNVFRITDVMPNRDGRLQLKLITLDSTAFSSGNGVLVKDIARLKDFLRVTRNAIYLPLHTSVPEDLQALLQPSTIVIHKRDLEPKKELVNPIFSQSVAQLPLDAKSLTTVQKAALRGAVRATEEKQEQIRAFMESHRTESSEKASMK